MKKGKKENKIMKFLYNPWIVGVAFYLLGLLTPKTVATLKEFSLIKRETNHIDVVGNMYVNQISSNNKFFFFAFLLILALLLFILIASILEDDE